jgi:ABC-type transport system substrate-binding protein
VRPQAPGAVALALIVAACGSVESPEPTTSTPASGPPSLVDDLIVGIHIPSEDALGDFGGPTPTDLPLFSLDPNGNIWDLVGPRLVYSGVYRLDANYAPVPDLAAEPCATSADLLVITCRLHEASFHDGTPLTARDVAFTYELLMSDACRLPPCGPEGIMGQLEAVSALDERTVEFRLAQPDASFFTTVLPSILIEPRDSVERAFAEFAASSAGADPGALEAAASGLQAALAEQSECGPELDPTLADAESAAAALGLALRTRDDYERTAGSASAGCAFGEYLARVLGDAADAVRLDGTDAIAAAYRILEVPAIPVGTGPWRVRSIDPGVSLQLEGFDAFHRGAPVTPRVEVRLIRTKPEAVEALRSGAIHWLVEPLTLATDWIVDGVGDASGVVLTEYHDFSFRSLHYNLRDGRLFADKNLRAAMELCFDKEETVAAATGGTGVPVYSPISPAVWAFEPDLPRPARDVEAGRQLIETSGWVLGDDGIYRQGERRLATTVPVFNDPALVRFAELLAAQVAECGIEFVPRAVSFDELVVALTWPLVPPGADQPADAWLYGWFTGADPDSLPIFDSDAIASESNPEGFNVGGYASPESNALLEQARAAQDTRERARLYREHQRILAEDRPVLFAWSPLLQEARSDRVQSTAGALETDTLNWWWQLETLIVAAPLDP